MVSTMVTKGRQQETDRPWKSSNQQKKSFWGILKVSFVQGLVVVIPVMLTFWILRLFYAAIDGTVTPALERVLENRIPGLGFVVAVLIILVVGLVSRVFIGRQVLTWLEKIITSIPLIRTIYSGSKDLMSAFSLGSKGKTFQKVLVLEYPRKGLYTVGFMTNEVEVVTSEGSSEFMYSVYVPNPPNPTSGVLLLVPKGEAVEANLSIEEALKLVLSGGIVSPAQFRVSKELPVTSIRERSSLAEKHR